MPEIILEETDRIDWALKSFKRQVLKAGILPAPALTLSLAWQKNCYVIAGRMPAVHRSPGFLSLHQQLLKQKKHLFRYLKNA